MKSTSVLATLSSISRTSVSFNRNLQTIGACSVVPKIAVLQSTLCAHACWPKQKLPSDSRRTRRVKAMKLLVPSGRLELAELGKRCAQHSNSQHRPVERRLAHTRAVAVEAASLQLPHSSEYLSPSPLSLYLTSRSLTLTLTNLRYLLFFIASGTSSTTSNSSATKLCKRRSLPEVSGQAFSPFFAPTPLHSTPPTLQQQSCLFLAIVIDFLAYEPD